MEHLGQEVTDVNIDAGHINITYANGGIEQMVKGEPGYRIMHTEWLVEQPPFISDIFKVQMRDITLVTINNDQKCLNSINEFFVNENKEQVVKFLNYMRKRDLTQAKSIWTKR